MELLHRYQNGISGDINMISKPQDIKMISSYFACASCCEILLYNRVDGAVYVTGTIKTRF